MKKFGTILMMAVLLLTCGQFSRAQKNVVDEVIWVVGDEPILKSDVEFQRLNAELNGQKISGDPYTVIPEQLAIQKLFLHQASIDSINVTEADVMPYVNAQMERMINLAGSQEKLEEYRGVPMKQIRQEVIKYFIESKKIDDEKKKIIGDKKISPAEVRRYFKNMPKDSLPYIPTQVEVQILTQTPEIAEQEIERVKNELQEYAKRVNSGESSFATLARLYSQDEGSARQGGELGYCGRAEWVPEFANVAFSLTDPNTVSKIVQTEFGYHILQLIGRKGDKVNVRHILLKPVPTDDAIKKCILRLDSIANDIKSNKFSFDHAVYALSDDKDTKNNNGLMVNTSLEDETQTSRFEMKDLQQDVAKVVDKMHVGEVSNGFSMINKDGKQVCAIVLLKNRINGHKADITEDFQALTDIVSNKKNEEVLEKWIKEKQKTTYISIKDEWKRTDFKYPGWIK
ncbi:MAG: peptidylprolyl isomerase [Bacteroidaceae bacterium]|jgi:peptidyl-prolyl cis-trans isomerase SurA|nr:peptidylprolyl isomerase [Bacteroidaceae bacterium]